MNSKSIPITQESLTSYLTRRGWEVIDKRSQRMWDCDLERGISLWAMSPKGNYKLSIQAGFGLCSDPTHLTDEYKRVELAILKSSKGKKPGINDFVTHEEATNGQDVTSANYSKVCRCIEIVESWEGKETPTSKISLRRNPIWDLE